MNACYQLLFQFIHSYAAVLPSAVIASRTALQHRRSPFLFEENKFLVIDF